MSFVVFRDYRMKKLLLGAFAFAPFLAAAQIAISGPPTQESVKLLERRLAVAERLNKGSAASLHAMKAELRSAATRLDAVVKVLEVNAGKQAGQLQGMKQGQEDMRVRMSQESQSAATQVVVLHESIEGRTTAFAGILSAVFLVFAAVAAMGWQRQRTGSKGHDALSVRLDDVARQARASEERAAACDTSIADSLVEMLKGFNSQAHALATPASKQIIVKAEPDHNLPSKLADEIHRMRKRMGTLPEDTKGLTPLKKSLDRLEAELAVYGYEIIDHTGQSYSDNMSIKARFIPSEELGPEVRLISKVVVPQLNHAGVMVRMADVEVSIGS